MSNFGSVRWPERGLCVQRSRIPQVPPQRLSQRVDVVYRHDVAYPPPVEGSPHSLGGVGGDAGHPQGHRLQ